MMKAVMYTRVSTKEQADNRTSLATQEKECRDFARKNDVIIPDNLLFSDRGESAKFADRPALQRMLAYIKQNKDSVDTLYIWKIDRLARNLGDYYGIKVALTRYGVKIVSVTEPIDDDPVGRFLEAILAAAAQFDNEIRAVRTVMGMKSRVEQGGWPYQAPIGYIKTKGRIVKDPVHGDSIANVLTEFSTGNYSLADISRYAFDQGVTTKSGKAKTTDQMKDIVRNMIYAGFNRTKLVDKLVKGLHKPIVDQSVIYKNIDIIAGEKKNYVLKGDELFPLRGSLLCSNCSGKLTASTPRGNGGIYIKYHCNKPTCRQKITGKKASVDADLVHKEFRELLEKLKPLKAIEKLFKTIVLEAWNDEYGNAVENIRILNREVDNYRNLRNSTMKKYIADKITEADKDAQIQNIDSEISRLNDDKEMAENYLVDRENIVNDAMEFISNPDYVWNRAELAVRKDIQTLLFPNGIVYDFETGFGTIQKPETYLLIQKMTEKSVIKSDLVAATGIEPVTLGL